MKGPPTHDTHIPLRSRSTGRATQPAVDRPDAARSRAGDPRTARTGAGPCRERRRACWAGTSSWKPAWTAVGYMKSLPEQWDAPLVDLMAEPPADALMEQLGYSEVGEPQWLPWRMDGDVLTVATCGGSVGPNSRGSNAPLRRRWRGVPHHHRLGHQPVHPAFLPPPPPLRISRAPCRGTAGGVRPHRPDAVAALPSGGSGGRIHGWRS